ncbi:MAG: type II toxin-antitoxin system death-on-curing family toxin [Chloroflexota bacterium]|nr:type II toxin-antitoxin system death-on-curing family toxin [Chloroflexota bacterium]
MYLLHERLIQLTGGSSGLRDPGLLESAVPRPQASFDGEELYPDLWTKAAALMQSLIKNHPFVIGNKRTAVTATGVFLELNHHRLTASNMDLCSTLGHDLFHLLVRDPIISAALPMLISPAV